jgi:hypothetical protein|tara:strand:+ start:328 stop:627 length:300 start_codon:yes stop_codon:yes gene_type:complete
MKINYIYEWQIKHLKSDSVDQEDDLLYLVGCATTGDRDKSLKGLLNNKTWELTLMCSKTIENELEDRQFAFVNNYKLDEYFDEGRKVPQKHIKEFNNLI